MKFFKSLLLIALILCVVISGAQVFGVSQSEIMKSEKKQQFDMLKSDDSAIHERQRNDFKKVKSGDIDLTLIDGVMNFFSYVDYTNPQNSNYFHMSSHYGMIPAEQFNSANDTDMVFNGIVRNNGADLVNPEFNVKVYDPEMSLLYDESVMGMTLSSNQVDTIDLLDAFILNAPEIGEYMVVYEAIASGDENLIDNCDTTYFHVTENIFARDLGNMTGSISPDMWSGAGDNGDMISTNYVVLYETDIMGMDVFIHSDSDAGSTMIAHVMFYDDAAADWITVSSSDPIIVEEEMIGDWYSISLDPVTFDPENYAIGNVVKVAVEFSYDGTGNNFRLGYDPNVSASIWGVSWYLLTYDSWMSISNWNDGGPGIRLITGNAAEQDYFFEAQHTMCDGESYYWQGNYYSESGTYLAEYQTANGCCDSIYELELIVQPSPLQYSLIQSPSNGIFQTGEYGEISLSLSEANVDYWTTRAGVIYSAVVSGTGSMLSLGDNFVAGTYDVWSRNDSDCEVLQGSVTFIENNGNNQLIANITYGSNTMNFPANEVEVTLYKVTTDIEMNEVIAVDQQKILGNSGYVVFEAIEPGDYYLGSTLLNPESFDVSSHVYYEAALTHEDASIITMDTDDMLVVSLHHPTLEGIEGSNTVGGIVGEGNTKSDLSPLADMIIVMQDAVSEQVLDVTVTNSEGQYNFEVIPDNTNVELYVTSFAHQEWTPFVLETTTNETYEVNFMVSGDEVYPMSIGDLGNQLLIDVNIYPNPTSGIITVESENLNLISVSSLDGKQMIQKAVSEDQITLDLSKFSAGMYLIQLETENGVRVIKIVLE